MRWSVVGLALAGVAAAICAVVLVEAIQVNAQGARRPAPSEPPPVEVFVATRALPAMTVIDSGAVVGKTVPADKAPERFVASATRIVGRVLAVPMVEGQVFSPTCFAGEGSAIHLASALPEGKRAVSVSLADYSRLDGLLYPGSLVDVLASFRLPSSNSGRGEAVSTTLLQGIEVLAVEDRTVVSPDDESTATRPERRSGIRRMVTLMVDTEQAKALQLATEHGTISLAMRNPLDAAPVDEGEATRLSELSRVLQAFRESPEVVAVAPASQPTSRPAAPTTTAPAPQWETVILRGGAIETRTFLLSTAETPASDGK